KRRKKLLHNAQPAVASPVVIRVVAASQATAVTAQNVENALNVESAVKEESAANVRSVASARNAVIVQNAVSAKSAPTVRNVSSGRNRTMTDSRSAASLARADVDAVVAVSPATVTSAGMTGKKTGRMTARASHAQTAQSSPPMAIVLHVAVATVAPATPPSVVVARALTSRTRSNCPLTSHWK